MARTFKSYGIKAPRHIALKSVHEMDVRGAFHVFESSRVAVPLVQKRMREECCRLKKRRRGERRFFGQGGGLAFGDRDQRVVGRIKIDGRGGPSDELSYESELGAQALHAACVSRAKVAALSDDVIEG